MASKTHCPPQMGILIGTTLADTPAEEILLTPGKSLSWVFFPSFCPRSFSSPSPILSEKKEVKNRDMQEEHKWWEDEWSFALGAIPCLMRYNLVKPSFISAANLVHREIQCGEYSVPQLNEERWRQMCHKIQLKQLSYVSTWAHVMSCKPCLATSMYKSLIFYP